MLRGVMVAAALAGCADVPEELPTSVRDVAKVEVTAGNTVTAAGIALAFADTGVRLPLSLTYTSTEILAQNGCPEPSLAGVVVAPFQSAYGGNVVPGATSTLDLLLTGPVVARADVRYDLPYDCAGKQALQGSSTFTVFPNGRIVRTDAVKPSTTPVADAASCTQTCNAAPEDNATFATFWALAPGGERFTPGTTTPVTSTVTTQFSCTRYGDTHTVGIGWDTMTMPVARSSEVNGTLVSEYPFLDKRASVSPTTETARSTVFVGNGQRDCAELEAQMRMPAMLLFNGTAVARDTFDVYADTADRGARIEITTPPGEEVPEGFAIRARIDAHHLRVTHSDGRRIDVGVQAEGDAHFIWIPSALPADGAIILEAL